mmetsp:Transcript_9369/g.17307  ORF Transcript_9369/g.17307 Transcript_9369/m.17307 type:complete len:638 (-) Transcript_9369:181-2094(-)
MPFTAAWNLFLEVRAALAGEEWWAFWHGAPYILDVDAWVAAVVGTSDSPVFTILFNRLFILLNSPYWTIAAIFLTGASAKLLRTLSEALFEADCPKQVTAHPASPVAKSNLKVDNSNHEVQTPYSGQRAIRVEDLPDMAKEYGCEGIWIIHGRYYDLTPFMKRHPGGDWPLRMTKNSDATILFECYHVFAHREVLDKMLGPYEIRETSLEKMQPSAGLAGTALRAEGLARLPPPDPLLADIHKMCRDHFAVKSQNALTVGKRPHGMKASSFLAYGLVFSLSLFSLYRVLAKQELVFVYVLALCEWIYGAALFHNCSHFAAFDDHRVNRFASFLGGWPWISNSASWMIQHVIQHHQFTDQEEDIDLFHFMPLVRTTRAFSEHESHHRWQLPLIFVLLPTTSLHLLLVVPYDLLFKNKVPPSMAAANNPVRADEFKLRYHQCKHLTSIVGELWWQLVAELVCYFAFVLFFLTQLGFCKGVLFYFSVITVQSWLFIIFTQGSHLREDCMKKLEKELEREAEAVAAPSEFREEDVKKEVNPVIAKWVREQVAYTVDYSVDSRFWWFVSGGLNMQVIHHLLPVISHCHYVELYPKLVAVLREHGVQVGLTTSFWAFLYEFFYWIWLCSRQEVQSASCRKCEQ